MENKMRWSFVALRMTITDRKRLLVSGTFLPKAACLKRPLLADFCLSRGQETTQKRATIKKLKRRKNAGSFRRGAAESHVLISLIG